MRDPNAVMPSPAGMAPAKPDPAADPITHLAQVAARLPPRIPVADRPYYRKVIYGLPCRNHARAALRRIYPERNRGACHAGTPDTCRCSRCRQDRLLRRVRDHRVRVMGRRRAQDVMHADRQSLSLIFPRHVQLLHPPAGQPLPASGAPRPASPESVVTVPDWLRCDVGRPLSPGLVRPLEVVTGHVTASPRGSPCEYRSRSVSLTFTIGSRLSVPLPSATV
jgi:hypothetical protein